jgi:hypothetical protein
MKSSSSLRWLGWSVLLSGVSMILSISLTILAISEGWMTLGPHSHSAAVESFDALTTGFLLPLPFAFHWMYRSYAPRLSRFSTWLGFLTMAGVTILHILFVFEVLWFSDVGWVYIIFGAGFSAWLLCIAYLAYKSGKPPRGPLLNIVGASIVGFPVWIFWLGYLLASEKMRE